MQNVGGRLVVVHAPAVRRVQEEGDDAKRDERQVGREEPQPKAVDGGGVAHVREDLRRAVDDVDRADEAREDLVNGARRTMWCESWCPRSGSEMHTLVAHGESKKLRPR